MADGTKDFGGGVSDCAGGADAYGGAVRSADWSKGDSAASR